MTNRRLYSFWMTEAQRSGLRKVKQAEGITESDQIREALDAWLSARGALKRTPSNPAGDSAPAAQTRAIRGGDPDR